MYLCILKVGHLVKPPSIGNAASTQICLCKCLSAKLTCTASDYSYAWLALLFALAVTFCL